MFIKYGPKIKQQHLLRGIIRCGHCGYAMMPSYTKKNNRTYQYYLCGQASKRGHDTCPVKSVHGQVIEDAVSERVRLLLIDPAIAAQTAMALRDEGAELDARETAQAINSLGAAWENLFPAEKARLIRLLVEQVEIKTEGMTIAFRDLGLTTLMREIIAPAREQA